MSHETDFTAAFPPWNPPWFYFVNVSYSRFHGGSTDFNGGFYFDVTLTNISGTSTFTTLSSRPLKQAGCRLTCSGGQLQRCSGRQWSARPGPARPTTFGLCDPLPIRMTANGNTDGFFIFDFRCWRWVMGYWFNNPFSIFENLMGNGYWVWLPIEKNIFKMGNQINGRYLDQGTYRYFDFPF